MSDVNSTTLRQPHYANHTTPTTLLLSILVILALSFVAAPPAHSQTVPLGTITVPRDPIACGSSFYTGMQCFKTTVSCPGTDNIGVTFGYVGPTVAPTPQGTIVFFSGGSGTTPAAPGEDILSYSDNYVQNFTIIYVAWASAWENASPSGTYPENILLAACRPATLLAWINGSGVVHSAGAMCAQGKSAGSAAIAYSLSWYGAGSYLKNVELLSGPVLSRIDDGCKVPAPTVSMCPSGGICTAGSIAWSRNAGYTPDKTGDINTWAGINNCAQSGITSSELTTLADMSIVDGVYSGVTANFSFCH